MGSMRSVCYVKQRKAEGKTPVWSGDNYYFRHLSRNQSFVQSLPKEGSLHSYPMHVINYIKKNIVY